MSLQWYARYAGDYLRDTAHLSLLEHGAYTLLMDYYYSTGQPLPANADANAPALALATNERLYRICRAVTQIEQEAVDSVLSCFFDLDDGNYYHDRIDRELEKRSDISEKRSAANAKMREARKNKSKAGNKQSASADASADANAVTNDQQVHSTTTTTSTVYNNKGPGLKDLAVQDIEVWLNGKRAGGKYLMIDEHRLLEVFKDYCKSKGKTYKDYVAGYRNAFEWNNAPKKGQSNETNRHGYNRANKSDRAKEAIARGLASAE